MALRRNPSLDIFRGSLIVLVMAGHLELTGALTDGQSRVVAFFVLSGFLITTMLVKRFDRDGSVGARSFYISRLARFVPVLAMVSVLCLVASFLAPLVSWESLSVPIPFLVSSLPHFWSQTINLGLQDAQILPYELVPSWSLGAEWQFYLLWPAAVWFCLNRWGKRGLLWLSGAVAVLGFSWSAWLTMRSGGQVPRVEFGSDTRGAAILLGCLTAVVVTYDPPRRWIVTHRHWLLAVGMTALVAMFFDVVGDYGMDMTAWGQVVVAVAASVVAAVGWLWPGDLLANAPQRLVPVLLASAWIGQRALVVFLVHVPLMQFIGGPRGVLPGLGVMAASFGIAAISYRWVEIPFTAWAKSRWLPVVQVPAPRMSGQIIPDQPALAQR